jgi:type VI secretion system Hcp family effector
VAELRGDSTDRDHRDWSDATDYHHAVRVESSLGSRDPRDRGRLIHDPFVVTKPADGTSAQIFEAAQDRRLLSRVRLEVCHSTRERQCFLHVEFEDVRIASYSQDEKGETLGFEYRQIEWTYRPFDSRGGAPFPELLVRWDLTADRGAGPTTNRRGSAIGFGRAGQSLLVLDRVAGEASFDRLEDVIGLTAFNRGLTEITMTKGTDIATPVLLWYLHDGERVRRPVLHYGCIRDDRPCAGSFEFDEARVMELSYGASQVERLRWEPPPAPPRPIGARPSN